MLQQFSSRRMMDVWPVHINSTLAHALQSEVDRFNCWINILASTNVEHFFLFFAVTQCKLFSISLCVSFVLAVRAWKCAVIQSWQARFQSKMSCYWKQYCTQLTEAADRLVLSLTCSFSFCRGFQHDFLFWHILTDMLSSLPSRHTHYTHTHRHTHSVR